MRRAAILVLISVLGSLVAACGTAEYQQARQACYQEWGARIPPDYRQVLVNRERRVKVPDGTETCTTTGNTTRCEKGMRTEWIPYTAVETVDANAETRSLRIRQCAASRCLRAYGNPDCEV